MSDPVILEVADHSDTAVRVTFGTVDYGQAHAVINRDAINDPGTLTMLKALYDRQRSINTTRRRSANPRK